MAEKTRIKRLNSLLQEVISEVIQRDVRDPRIHAFTSITKVDLSNDLQHAKIYVSILANDKEKKETLEALQSAAGFIAVSASKKVVMRYFPALIFKLDSSVEEHLRIEKVIEKIHEEERSRKPGNL
ncbi:MAG TPA: 30S ribosome-binding factor RbfA [Rhabdochlamydiaceae bacterium]|nr:30S ribosome-binding factor RbfA [Rhabdochlamydiaceae bacterium]